MGSITVDGVFECYTVENADLAVPAGTYALELYDSPKHGPETPQLVGVPGRTNCQIHKANWARELEGCIAPGTSHGPDYVEHSGAACVALFPRLRAAIRGDGATLVIEEAP